MSQPFARTFYNSTAWKHTRNAYASSVGGLCERCLRVGRYVPGEIVHHIHELTPDNIGDPGVALDWSNLELVCRDCHAELHENKVRRFTIDEWGRVIT